jgi:hypothetical protein
VKTGDLRTSASSLFLEQNGPAKAWRRWFRLFRIRTGIALTVLAYLLTLLFGGSLRLKDRTLTGEAPARVQVATSEPVANGD